MKNTLLYSALVLLLAAMACNKTNSVNGESDGLIRFAPATEDTRAMVYKASLTSETFRVYDFLTKDATTTKYIDNQIEYQTNAWAYTAPNEDYLWKNGTHKLFGYSTSLGALPDSKTITLQKVMTTSAEDQVDYLYSEIVKTTAYDWKHDNTHSVGTPVQLTMKHLFTAVSMAVKNNKTAQITLNSITVPQIPNSSTATINYSGDAVVVNPGTPIADETTPFVSFATAANADVSAGGQFDLLTQAVGAPANYMVWPQTFPGMTLNVQYKMNGSVYETSVTIPSLKWEAGKIYQYKLVIANADDILLDFTVKDWQDGGSENLEFE